MRKYNQVNSYVVALFLSHFCLNFSGSRGRVNAWLPLYVNDVNWKYAKSWAPSAFSIIATQFNDMFEVTN